MSVTNFIPQMLENPMLMVSTVLTLGELRDAQVDMFTTVFIGNSQTKILGGKLVTPRGYLQR